MRLLTPLKVLAIAVLLGTSWLPASAPDFASAQILPPTNPPLTIMKRYRATDLGAAASVGGMNNESGNGLTMVLGEERFQNGVRRNFPIIATIDDPCRDRFDLDQPPGVGFGINDSRIVVGAKGIDAFEWFPTQCANSVQAGALPRLPPAGNFFGAQAISNNNARDAVGVTSVLVPSISIFQNVPTVWRAGATAGTFSVQQLQTAFRPAPFNNVRQPGVAFDINESGTIVGETTVNLQAFTRACIYQDGLDPLIIQRTPGAADLLFRPHVARGVSNNGFITGHATRFMPGGAPRQSRGFVRTPEGEIIMTLIPDDDAFVGSDANKINNNGIAVGKLLKSDGGSVAALWNAEGRLAFLNGDNVDGLPAGAALTEAVDINDNGSILAKGLVNGQLRAFVLRPRGVLTIFWPESLSN
jgi:hypothetical protein